MVGYNYDVESVGLGGVHRTTDMKTAIEKLLNDRDAEGWEYVESLPSPDHPSTRLFIFRRERDDSKAG